MGFFAEPAFFVLCAIAAVPAVVLGLRECRQHYYALGISIVFLVLLFAHDLRAGAACLFFAVWSCALVMANQRLFASEHPSRIGVYRVLLALSILPLVASKVFDLFGGNPIGFIGISYLTFKVVQVLIETRDGLIQKMGLVEFLAFLLFFPVFTSGPIMRSRDFMEGVDKPLSREEYLDGLGLGLERMLGGAVYKFVCAAFFSWLSWFAPQAIGYATPLAAFASETSVAGAYGLYLFFDFAGYSLMAMGLGALFGVKVPRNFHMPFLSVDIKDFWNRWHISLSWWLRDFVFMRLSRALLKRKVFSSRTTTACAAYVANMGLMGCWHGLTIDYVVYGLYHGLLLAACELVQKKWKPYRQVKDARWFKVASWALTMVAVFFGFSLFSGQVSGLIRGV